MTAFQSSKSGKYSHILMSTTSPQDDTTTQRSATEHTTNHTDLPLCPDATLGTKAPQWVPAGHPLHTGARMERPWVARKHFTAQVSQHVSLPTRQQNSSRASTSPPPMQKRPWPNRIPSPRSVAWRSRDATRPEGNGASTEDTGLHGSDTSTSPHVTIRAALSPGMWLSQTRRVAKTQPPCFPEST